MGLNSADLTSFRRIVLQCAMAEREPPQQPHARVRSAAQQTRLEREAAALRQNLLRRKQQARERAEPKPDKPKT